jgi:hypothetical protein
VTVKAHDVDLYGDAPVVKPKISKSAAADLFGDGSSAKAKYVTCTCSCT